MDQMRPFQPVFSNRRKKTPATRQGFSRPGFGRGCENSIPPDKHLKRKAISGYNSRMTSMPDWLAQPPSNGLPDWLSGAPVERTRRRDALPPNQEGRALLFVQFESVFPRILEMMCAGYTLDNAIKELPPTYPVIDPGAFMRWLRKNPKYHEMYKEAKEIRTEAWAGRIIAHAEGAEEGTMNDTARSRLIVDTYKWLMGADNRKQYGDTKTIEMNTNISITAALAQAQGRVIEAQLVEDDVDLIEEAQYKQITSGDEDDD